MLKPTSQKMNTRNLIHPAPIAEEKEDSKPTTPRPKFKREETADLSAEEENEDEETLMPKSSMEVFSVRTAPEGEVSQEQNEKKKNDTVDADFEIPDIPGSVKDDLTRKSSDTSVTSAIFKNMKQQGNIDALKNATRLTIKQTNKDKEDFANVPNNYDILSKNAGRIFIGKEETHPEVRAKVKTSTNISQAFRMSIFDVSTGHEVLRIDRDGVNEAPTHVVQKKFKSADEDLGVIIFETGCLMMVPTYYVQNAAGDIILRITGPPSGRLCHSIKYVTSTFDIFDSDGIKRVAKITKDGDFYVNLKEKTEAVTKEENLYIDFEDSTMDVKTKALILGTTFMLDYTYYKEPSFFTKLASFFCVVCGSSCAGGGRSAARK